MPELKRNSKQTIFRAPFYPQDLSLGAFGLLSFIRSLMGEGYVVSYNDLVREARGKYSDIQEFSLWYKELVDKEYIEEQVEE